MWKKSVFTIGRFCQSNDNFKKKHVFHCEITGSCGLSIGAIGRLFIGAIYQISWHYNWTLQHMYISHNSFSKTIVWYVMRTYTVRTLHTCRYRKTFLKFELNQQHGAYRFNLPMVRSKTSDRSIDSNDNSELLDEAGIAGFVIWAFSEHSVKISARSVQPLTAAIVQRFGIVGSS